MNIKLTVYFDEPFWVGVFERQDSDGYSVSRVVFGQEPKDYAIYEMILREYYKLNFSRSSESFEEPIKHINPKRLQREINREIENRGAGTKAQQALKSEYELRKLESKKSRKFRREKEDEESFRLRQEKKKEKKKGH